MRDDLPPIPTAHFFPLESFDYPQAHIRYPFDPDTIALAVGFHCAGSSLSLVPVLVRDWLRGDYVPCPQYKHGLRELIDQLTGYELVKFHFEGGASTFEFASALMKVEPACWTVAHYVNFWSSWPRPELPDGIDWLDVIEASISNF